MIHPGRGTDVSAQAVRLSQAYQQILGKVRDVARYLPGDPEGARDAFGVLSTGERIAVALVLDRFDLLAAERWTMLEAVDRLGEMWLAAATLVQRDGWCE